MSETYLSLSHSKWDCKYHVVFVPKRRRKVIFGQTRRQLGTIFHALARQKECQIIEGHLMPDHVHMCIAIPPKHPVASVIGFLKGKSAIAIARLSGKERNFSGEHFWARGYAVSTVGWPNVNWCAGQSVQRPADLFDRQGRAPRSLLVHNPRCGNYLRAWPCDRFRWNRRDYWRRSQRRFEGRIVPSHCATRPETSNGRAHLALRGNGCRPCAG